MKRGVKKIVVACAVLSVGIGYVVWSQVGARPGGAMGLLHAEIDRDVLARPEPAGADMSPEFRQRGHRGSRTPMRLPRVQAGIAMGDGTFVPPLNGVRVEDVIPPVRRNRRLPPPGPIVAKIVDRSGQEWWEHEDGSQTSCSFASVTTRDGVTRQIVSTQHGAVTHRPATRPR